MEVTLETTSLKYCPSCKEDRPGSQDFCDVCGATLTDPPGGDPQPLGLPPVAREQPSVGLPPVPTSSARSAPSPGQPIPATPEPSLPEGPSLDPPPLQPASKPAKRTETASTGTRLKQVLGELERDIEGSEASWERKEPPPPNWPEEEAAQPEASHDVWRESPQSTEPSVAEPIEEPAAAWESEKAREAYEQIVQRVQEHLNNGSDLFGFVGQAASGKTYALKALDRLLRDHGVGAPEAQFKFDEAHAPGASEAKIFDYVYTGEQANWVIMDAGGELYAAIQDNDWYNLEADQAQLTHFLHHCKGLFFFLHLTQAHFDPRLMSQDPSLDDEANEQAKASVKQARRAQRELMFFRNFLLFLRALKAENGNVTKVIAQCRRQQSLEKGLRSYEQTAPRLDIPIMCFFTKADSYGPGFEIANGIQFDPRNIPMGPMVFTARYLPLLFQGLLQHARRFKFDFLQSYVEYPMERDGMPLLDEVGDPLVSIHWVSDATTPLSVGLLSGLEFVLRNQPAKGLKGLWHNPGIDTRLALLLHRQRHPKLWQGVKGELGSYSQALKEML